MYSSIPLLLSLRKGTVLCSVIIAFSCADFDSSMGLGSSSEEMAVDLEQTRVIVKGLIDSDKIVIFSKTTCPYCRKAKSVSLVI